MANQKPILRFGSGSRAESGAEEDRDIRRVLHPASVSVSVSASASVSAPAVADSGLPEIRLNELGDRLLPSGDTSREMHRIFHGHLTAGTSWSKVHKNVRDSYFYEFKKKFRWASEIDGLIEYAFNKQAGVRYNDLVNKAKKGFFGAGKVPINISDEVWDAWKAHWESDDAKKKSKQASANRMSEVGGLGTGISKHTCGSKSMRDYERDLERQIGKKPSMTEVFVHTHTKRHDRSTFIDKRSEAFSAQFHQALESRQEQSQHSTVGSNTPFFTSTDVDKDEVYLESASQKKKKCVYGAGHSSARSKDFLRVASILSPAPPVDQVPDLEQNMKRVVQKAMAAHREIMLKDMNTMIESFFQRYYLLQSPSAKD